MKTKMKPIVSWGIWAIGLSLVMGTVTRKFILEGFKADITGMSYVIATLFIVGLIASFRAAMQLHSELAILDRIKTTDKIPEATGKEGIADIFNKLFDYRHEGKSVNITTVIDTYYAGHNSRVRSITIMAALLISMGLLGTIIGLIMAISGLGDMVENIGVSQTSMMGSLKTTVAGMGTAFYTTFFGALGGLILRAVGVSQLNSLTELCASATEYADTNLSANLDTKDAEVNQQVSKVIQSFENMQQKIDDITSGIANSVESSMQAFGQNVETAGAHATTATQESITGMTNQLESLGGEIGRSFGFFNESVVHSSESLTEAVGELQSAISQATGEMVTMSEARLDAEASEIAGQLSLAASSIQEFIKQKNSNADNKRTA